MSGVEAIVVLGVISSVISIVDGTKQVFDAATNAQGLPEAFREVAARLQIIRNILGSTKRHIEDGNADENSYKGAREVVEGCKRKAEKLEAVFQKVIPADGASRVERYLSAVRTLGKGSRVEILMKGMLEDVQLLAIDHGMTTVADTQRKEVADAIEEVAALHPSIPENAIEGTGFTSIHSGSGPINQVQGDQYNNFGSGQIYHAQSMTFGSNNLQFESSRPRLSDVEFTSQFLPSATPAFFGRESELKETEDFLLSKGGQKVVVLTGIGGLGKTQIALHFWTTVLSSFREVALVVGDNVASGFNDIASRQPMMAIKSWLALADNTRWLLVIDNVEDLDCDYSLHDIIPKCDHGAILVTTTQSETAGILGGLNIEVGMIEKDAGAAILRRRFKRKTYTDEEKKLTHDIIDALHGVPLAIEQAGAYLQFNSSLTTAVLKSFLKKLSSTSTQADILAKIPKRSMWFYEKHRSVIDTFSLLKTSLTRNNDDAFKCSDYLGIPGTRIRANYDETQETYSEALIWLRRITAEASIYYKALETLEQFCCIKRRLAPDESTYLGYSMHNVIRSWCQETMNSEEQAKWTIIAAFQLGQCLQLDTVSVLSHQIYSRHVEFVKRILLDPQYASLVKYPDGPYWKPAFLTAWVWARFYQRQRRADLARHMVEVLIYYEKTAFDNQWPSQRESLESLHLQATLFWEEGDFSNASQHYKVLLQACETHLGHFDDLTTKALQELRNVQDRLKRHLHDWQKASCTAESDSQPHHKEEDGETPGLQQFLVRYSDPTVTEFQLHKAASTGHKAEVQLLLKMGADVAEGDETGKTPLHWAAREGHVAVVGQLLEKGADVTAEDENRWTALHWGAQKGYEAVVRLLLENRADVTAGEENRWTALHLAAREGHEAVVQLLLEKGAGISAMTNYGKTPLHWAARKGRVTVVRQLLEKGADVTAEDGNRWTALHWAAQEGHEATVRLLLEKGADVTAEEENRRTALHWAARGGHEVVVRLLLEKGADVTAEDGDRWTALHWATRKGHVAVVRQLLEKWADVTAEDRNIWMALHWAAQEGHEAILRLLIEKGADTTAMTNYRNTALHYAAQKGHVAVVQLLLEKGADVIAEEENRWTALHYAAQEGHKAIVQLLLEREADMMAMTNYGRTALHCAAQKGHKGIVRLLLKKGADVTAEDGNRWTALHYAAQEGHEAIVRLLLEKGADIAAEEENRWTALHLAAQERHKAIVRLLLEKGADVTTESEKRITAQH